MKSFLPGALALALLPGAAPQDEPPDINFQAKVNKAIDTGAAYLKGKKTPSFHQEIENGNELILLTLLHAGVKDSDEDFQELLKYALESKLERTYKVALTAMCFEEYDRVKYQWRIHQCAQFLADNISAKGQTRYGVQSLHVEDIKPTPTNDRKDVTTQPVRRFGEDPNKPKDAPPRGEKPRVVRTIQVKQSREGPGDHDHSNMQYAALGLRACHDAGMRFEAKLLKEVDDFWRKNQIEDKDAREEILQLDPPKKAQKPGPGSTKALVAVKAAPEGWGYQGNSGEARGSMTAGAVGALCILDYLQGKDWREDRDVLQGMQWINRHFSVTENPEMGEKWYYYYMYGLERAGMLFGTETIGSHRWYREGADQLIKDQAANGSWGGSVVDTCFAILFLKRATRRLDVATRAAAK
jgi:hypothetical protein